MKILLLSSGGGIQVLSDERSLVCLAEGSENEEPAFGTPEMTLAMLVRGIVEPISDVGDPIETFVMLLVDIMHTTEEGFLFQLVHLIDIDIHL